VSSKLQAVPPAVVGDALEAVARHGEVFELPILDDSAGTGDALAPGPHWRPFDDLVAREWTDPLREAIEGFAVRIGAPVSRPVASLLHLGVSARFCFPLLATAAEFGVLPNLDSDRLRYTFDGSGRFRLALRELPDGVSGDLHTLAERLRDQVVRGHLARLTRAINQVIALPPATTDGNMASALAAAGRELSAEPAEPAESAPPRVMGQATQLLTWLLDHEPLRGAGTIRSNSGDTPGAGRFRRRNCCLFFQIPGGGTCADCILGT
jgi:hypothetical protein